MTITKIYRIGRSVRVRFGDTWATGKVTANNGRTVTVDVGSKSISIHESVIRRDLRVVPAHDLFRTRDRVKLVSPREDSDWIEAETGYKDVRSGLTGRITARDAALGMWEVELDRAGEQILFYADELEKL